MPIYYLKLASYKLHWSIRWLQLEHDVRHISGGIGGIMDVFGELRCTYQYDNVES